MKASPSTLLSLCLAYICASIALVVVRAADSVFTLGTPTFLGSGCPPGSVGVVASGDGQTVSVLFSEFAAGTMPTLLRDRKSCNLAVPVGLMPGISIGIFRVDYRGNAYVPTTAGASAVLDVTYFFAGASGPSYKKTWTPGTDQDYTITNKVGVSAILWTPCGAGTTFRINAAITASKAKAADDDVAIVVDTADTTIEEPMRFMLTYKTC